MRKRCISILLCLIALSLCLAAEGPPRLPKRTRTALLNFDYRPERNTTFQVPDSRPEAYNLVKTLLLELDYVPTAVQEERGDLIGPLVSKRRFRSDKLAEAIVVRLVAEGDGATLIVRSLFVVPDNGYIVDQSERRPTRVVRRFDELFEAKKKVVAHTDIYSVHVLIERAKRNLTEGVQLNETLVWLQLAEPATIPRSLAGRQIREMLHAVKAEIDRRERLQAEVAQLREKIKQAMAAKNWLEAHQAADEMIHVLLNHKVNEESVLFVEAVAARDRSRRFLARGARLLAFDTRLGPAEGNDIAVGFTVLNVSDRPIKRFDVTVVAADTEGQPVAGRIDSDKPIRVRPSQPIEPNEYFEAVVILHFAEPARPALARIKVGKVKH
ncbi:MAG: hypothetical protein ACTSXZ_11330 [Alphaproteobacteria bacterium]